MRILHSTSRRAPTLPALLAALAVALGVSPPIASAIPTTQQLTDSNAAVTFSVGTTWHTVHGRTSGVSGEITWDASVAPALIHASLRIPVQSFDTENSSRDSELQDVMEGARYPDVTVDVSSVSADCPGEPPIAATAFATPATCQGSLVCRVTIRDITKEMTLPYTGTWEGGAFVLHGTAALQWPEFGVKDPSIFIAHVSPKTLVTFQLTLPDSLFAASRLR